MKVTVTIENKDGQVLGQALTTKERITIGGAPQCTISLSDDKIASVESEIYLLNDECWLQVSKDGAPVTSKGKQYRTIKIEESTTLLFRQFSLKIILEKKSNTSVEATRIVGSEDIKTRVVDANDVMTRVVAREESTRIVEKTEEFSALSDMSNEQTRVLNTVEEKTRVVEEHDFKSRGVVPSKKMASFEEKEETMSFGFEKETEISGFRKAVRFDQLPQKLSQFNIKELVIIGLAALTCLFVIKLMFFNGNAQDLGLEKVASEQEEKLQKMNMILSRKSESGEQKIAPSDQSIQSVTRDEYLRSLSSFFDKH